MYGDTDGDIKWYADATTLPFFTLPQLKNLINSSVFTTGNVTLN
jgi:hypothetical protein